MDKLSFFYNDEFKVLNFLENNEEYVNGQIMVDISQEEIADKVGVSKHKIKEIIDILCENGYLEKGINASKYQSDDLLSFDAFNNEYKKVRQYKKYVITDKGHQALNDLKERDNLRKASNYKCASFFAGVGGIDLGFEKNGFEITYANEFDSKAIHTYEYNSDLKVDKRDINEVVNVLQSGNDPFDGKKFDIFLAGFPCQAFSIAGYREGFDDKKGRGNLFFELMKIARELKPSVMFLENVKNLVGHDKGKTFTIIKDTLEAEGYHIKYQVLNSMEYGNVPQNRERIYIVAFRDEEKCNQFRFPFPVQLKNNLKNVLNYTSKVEDRFYYTDKFMHYDVLKESMKSQDTVYQWRRVYVRENKNNVCPTLTANMGTGGHNVPLILTDYGIRKLTPKECFKLQGYPESFELPKDIAMSCLYKQAGNSVSVSVIERIAKEILRVLD